MALLSKLILCSLCNTKYPLKYFDGTYVFGTGWEDISHTVMTTLPFLLLGLSLFVIFDSDYALILCQLCKVNTLWNIFIILGRNVEQNKTTCHVLEWQFWLPYIWSYLLFLCLNLISCLLCSTNTLRNILIVLGRYEVQDKMTCCIQEWQPWLSYSWSYLPFLCVNLILCPLCNSNTLHNILMMLGRNIEQDEMTCHA